MTALSAEIDFWIIGDPHRTSARRPKRANIPNPYYFFRQHPWLCGLWKYRVQMRLHELSITFANSWGAVIHCGHLYNAVRSEKLLTREWPDVEIAFAVCDYDGFFVGLPPTNPDDYLKRYTMAIGASVTNFATPSKRNGRKTKGVKYSSRGPQGLSEQAPVLQTFKERYCESKPRFDLRAEDITKILQKSEWQYKMDDSNFPTTMIKNTDIVPGFTKIQSKDVVTLPRLLAILRAGIQAEVMELSYDYLTLHRSCWRMLRAIKERCRHRLIKIYGPDYIEEETQLPFLVGYILISVTNATRLADSFNIKKTNEITSAALEEAADVIDGMVQTGAGNIVGLFLKKLGVEYEFEGHDVGDEIEACSVD